MVGKSYNIYLVRGYKFYGTIITHKNKNSAEIKDAIKSYILKKYGNISELLIDKIGETTSVPQLNSSYCGGYEVVTMDEHVLHVNIQRWLKSF